MVSFAGVLLHRCQVQASKGRLHFLCLSVGSTSNDQQCGIQTRYIALSFSMYLRYQYIRTSLLLPPLPPLPPPPPPPPPSASHVSQLPSLNFIVYIPKATQYPLHIRSNNKARKTKEKDAPPPPPPPPATDTFLVPQWGGVVLYNPPGLGDETDANRSAGRRVDVDMEKVMPVFISQLKMLLGLPPTIVRML